MSNRIQKEKSVPLSSPYVFGALFGAPKLQIPFWTSKIDKKLHEVWLHTMWILHVGAPNRAPNYNFWKLHNLIFDWNKKSISYLKWLGFKFVSSFHVWKYALFDAFERSRELQIPCALAFLKIFLLGHFKFDSFEFYWSYWVDFWFHMIPSFSSFRFLSGN